MSSVSQDWKRQVGDWFLVPDLKASVGRTVDWAKVIRVFGNRLQVKTIHGDTKYISQSDVKLPDTLRVQYNSYHEACQKSWIMPPLKTSLASGDIHLRCLLATSVQVYPPYYQEIRKHMKNPNAKWEHIFEQDKRSHQLLSLEKHGELMLKCVKGEVSKDSTQEENGGFLSTCKFNVDSKQLIVKVWNNRFSDAWIEG